MKFAKLMDAKGAQVQEPVAVEGSISFDARTGEAQAWGADGKQVLASMVKARVVWIGPKGIRLEGMEPLDWPHDGTYRAMAWQLIY